MVHTVFLLPGFSTNIIYNEIRIIFTYFAKMHEMHQQKT